MNKHINKLSSAYKGPLTAAEAALGTEVAIRQAKQLFDDARTLFENGSFATSAALSSLSIEELGKVFTIREISRSVNANDLGKAWRGYVTHAKKAAFFVILNLLCESQESPNENHLHLSRAISEYSAGLPEHHVLDEMKQLGLYSRCVGETATWELPSDLIARDQAEKHLHLAESLVKAFGRADTQQQIELLAKHFPSDLSADDKLKAFENYITELQETGLLPTEMPNGLRIS